jgi:GntR family transcriptional regulator
MTEKTSSIFARSANLIDRSSPVPLYHQIGEAIIDTISRANLNPKTQIPSEEQLGKIFNVSKMTIRQALGKLVSEGILERRQGAGTFVSEEKIERSGTKLFSLYEDIQSRNLAPVTQVLEKKIIRPNKQVTQKLRLEKGDRIFKITRLRLANKTPLTINVAHIPEKACPDLLEEDLTQGSLFQLLEEKCRIVVKFAEQNIQAIKASAYDAKLLRIAEGDPLLYMERCMCNQDEIPVVYYLNFLRGDKYTFTSTSYR